MAKATKPAATGEFVIRDMQAGTYLDDSTSVTLIDSAEVFTTKVAADTWIKQLKADTPDDERELKVYAKSNALVLFGDGNKKLTAAEIRALQPKRGYRFDLEEFKLLFTFAAQAERAGKSAATACARAELTQGEHEALTLQGYAEEARFFMEKRESTSVDLSRGHLDALRTGASLYVSALSKAEETDEALLLDTEDHSVRREEALKLARKLGGGDLFDQVTVRFGGDADAEDDE